MFAVLSLGRSPESVGKIDFLTLVEWVLILALVMKSDFSMTTVGRIERFASAATMLCAIAFVLSARPYFAKRMARGATCHHVPALAVMRLFTSRQFATWAG